jgi:hypothetical protein
MQELEERGDGADECTALMPSEDEDQDLKKLGYTK